MSKPLDLIKETITHLENGAKSVRAFSNNETYIITKSINADEYSIAIESLGYSKTKTKALANYFEEVFGIYANY